MVNIMTINRCMENQDFTQVDTFSSRQNFARNSKED